MPYPFFAKGGIKLENMGKLKNALSTIYPLTVEKHQERKSDVETALVRKIKNEHAHPRKN